MKRLSLLASCVALSLASTVALAKPPAKPPAPPTPARPPPPPAVPAGPKSVKVTVVEIAGSRAYLEPGTKAGVRRTATVQIRGKEYRVVQASDSFAVIEFQGDAVHEKDEGRAAVVEEVDTKKSLPPPPPLSTWETSWTPAPAPASTQEPTFVPLGEANRDRRWDVRLGVFAGGLIPLSGQAGASIGFLQLDGRLHAEPFSVPAALDVDGSLRFWAANDLGSRVGGSTRSVVYVRELLLRYGSGGWFAGIGRMRYAASTLGTLDGLRVAAPLGGGFTLGAFGGLLPNPLSGVPSIDAQRFGIEARFSRPDAKLRPEAALVVHGSTFEGKLDERRVSAMFGVYPGSSRLGGHIEVSNFDGDNPWKSSVVEVTAAGLDGSFRRGPFEIGARFDLLQPVRSRWLASYLPPSWLCRTVPSPGVPPLSEPCDGSSSTRAIGSVNIGLSVDKVSFMVGASTTGDVTHGTEPRTLGGFATGRIARIAGVLRIEASGSASTATYMNMFTGSGGVGLTLMHEVIDVLAYYRHTELRYASVPAYVFQNAVGGTIAVFPTSSLVFTLQGEGMGGSDVNYLSILGGAIWRPRF